MKRLPGLLPFLLIAAVSGSPHALAQSNDSFANRLTLAGPAPVAVSNNLRATREPGEPNHAGAAAGCSLWYTWTAPTTGTINLSTYHTATGAPTVRAAAVYTGDALGALSEVASSNNQTQALYVAGTYSSPLLAGGTSLNVSVTAGTVYQIAVDAVPPPTAVDDDGTVVLAINAPPTILSAAGAVGTVGASFVYTVTASGGAGAYGAVGLPAGLAFNPATGQVAGTPSAAGVSTVALSATGPGGTGMATLTLRIDDASSPSSAPPVVTSAASARAFVGTSFAYTITASGSPTGFAVAGLPAGLSLNAATGAITGTPTQAGTYPVTLSATNATGTGSAVVTVAVSTVPPVPIITAALAATGTVGASFYYSLTTNVDGVAGAVPTAWTASNLPPGVTRGGSAYLSGTPTKAGTYAVPLTVTNAGGTRPATVTITILPAGTAPNTVVPAAPVLGSAAVAQGVAGTAFNYTLMASNAPTGFTAGNLPAGLSLNTANGAITGTPTQAGAFAVPVTAANAYGMSTGTLSLTIHASPAAQAAANGLAAPVLVSPVAAGGQVGTGLSYSLAATYQGNSTVSGGGTWTFAATGLPPGLSLAAATNSSGYNTISGTPTQTGTYPATITVTSPAVGAGYNTTRPAATSTATVTFFIVPASPTPPLITSAASVSSAVGGTVSYAVMASGSPTGYAASGLPPGLNFDAATGAVSGTPTTAGTYPATISATNAVGTGSATVTFRVTSSLPVFGGSASDWARVGTSRYYTLSVDNPPVTYGVDTASLPPGMSFSASGTTVAQIVGTPTTAGIYKIPVSATNASGTTRATLTFVVRPSLVLPVITADARMIGNVGSAFYNSLSANTDVASYGATNLPPGVTLNPNGALGGTPTTAGTYRVAVSATNAAGTGTATITMVISGGTAPWLGNSAAIISARGQYLGGGVTVLTQDATTITYTGLPPGLFATPVSGNPGAYGGTPNTAGVYPVKVKATSAGGTTNATQTITITSGTASGAPVIANTLAIEQFVNVGSSTSLTLSSSPAATGYAASGLPPGLTLDGASGVIAGTPTTIGTYPVTITASNAAGSASAVVNYRVQSSTSQYPPALLIKASIVAYAGVSHRNSNLDRGVSGETYAASGLPPGLSLDTATGEITGTPAAAGLYSVDVSAINAYGTTAAVWTYLIKDPSSLTPYFYSDRLEKSVNYGNALTLNSTPEFADYNSGVISGNTFNGTPSPLSFSVAGLPAGASYTSSGNVLSIVGGVAPVGTYPLTITATSPAGVSADEQVLFAVQEGFAPVVSSAAAAAGPANVAFSYSLTTNIVQPGSYSSGTLPAGLTLNSATGVISGTPTVPGTYAVPVSVNTPYNPATAVVTFRIDPPLYGGLPVLTSAAAAGSQDFPPDSSSLTSFLSPAVSYKLSALNLPISFAVGSVPAGMVFNPGTGILSGTPVAVGVYQVPVSATNAAGTFNATLTVVANSPRAGVQPALAYGGYVGGSFSNNAPLSFAAFASGYAAGIGYSTALDPVSYGAVGLPPGLSINRDTGQITGTPTQAGTYPATLSAVNRGGLGSATATFTVFAAAPPAAAPPVWSGKAEAAGFLGVPTSYLLTASTATNYAAAGLPAGLSLNPATGVISGTPTTTGTTAVAVTAGNSAGTTQAVLTFTIESAPFAPVVSSAGVATTTVGAAFSYGLITANLSGLPAPTGYAVAAGSLPVGLTLNPATGIISGAPVGPAGTYAVPVMVAVGPGATTAATLTIIVQPTPTAPLVGSAAGALGLVGTPFSYAVRNAAFVPDAGSLPTGLVYDATNGVIGGDPQAAGLYFVPLANAAGTLTAGLTLRVLAPDAALPRLVVQPGGGTAAEGASFTFTGAATGAPAPTYQWYKNGAALAGATDASLTLSPVAKADSGDYTVTATNAAGGVTSPAATLLVLTTYGQWQADYFTSQEIAAGLAEEGVSFSSDGVSNLLKYALDLNPRRTLDGALPVVASKATSDGPLGIEFNRDAGATDIAYLVEASPDLRAWTTIARSEAGTTTVGNGGSAAVAESVIAGTSQRHVTVKAAPPAGGAQFLRLRIVRF